MEGIVVKKPRWLNEIPKPIQINEKVEITNKMKKEVEEFENAVKDGSIDKWFNKNSKNT